MAFTIISSADIVFKAGAGADATIIANSDFMEYISEAAEAWVMGQTKVDWVAKYSTLDAEDKLILSDVVGDKAAWRIVIYETKGYLSQRIVELQIDLLDQNIKQGIAALNQSALKHDYLGAS